MSFHAFADGFCATPKQPLTSQMQFPVVKAPSLIKVYKSALLSKHYNGLVSSTWNRDNSLMGLIFQNSAKLLPLNMAKSSSPSTISALGSYHALNLVRNPRHSAHQGHTSRSPALTTHHHMKYNRPLHLWRRELKHTTLWALSSCVFIRSVPCRNTRYQHLVAYVPKLRPLRTPLTVTLYGFLATLQIISTTHRREKIDLCSSLFVFALYDIHTFCCSDTDTQMRPSEINIEADVNGNARKSRGSRVRDSGILSQPSWFFIHSWRALALATIDRADKRPGTSHHLGPD